MGNIESCSLVKSTDQMGVYRVEWDGVESPIEKVEVGVSGIKFGLAWGRLQFLSGISGTQIILDVTDESPYTLFLGYDAGEAYIDMQANQLMIRLNPATRPEGLELFLSGVIRMATAVGTAIPFSSGNKATKMTEIITDCGELFTAALTSR
ncbi:hypothetical protein JW962_03270 [Candidatus Dojkabacteria bacterium]|nr:hypothetical protein [Candidatus Dojkabacteria bacterium]